ncbi:antitoxin Xre/MbcA/ParS toxin-binding domain-containing protein [Pseudomonas sp. NPDC088444]|uniref:antitoxin Xre/MbcA/ParS toxin-binding domain-containing protein n=1 Tax=Pseudomonas sp. NPDC088444 TaxID=3364456 RepID=UPI00384B5A4E
MRKPGRLLRDAHDTAASVRLSIERSSAAYQYAKALEHATSVFGTQRSAEEWLGKPCRHLAGLIPLDLVDDVLGYQAVESYLERVELGVYQ